MVGDMHFFSESYTFDLSILFYLLDLFWNCKVLIASRLSWLILIELVCMQNLIRASRLDLQACFYQMEQVTQCCSQWGFPFIYGDSLDWTSSHKRHQILLKTMGKMQVCHRYILQNQNSTPCTLIYAVLFLGQKEKPNYLMSILYKCVWVNRKLIGVKNNKQVKVSRLTRCLIFVLLTNKQETCFMKYIF